VPGWRRIKRLLRVGGAVILGVRMFSPVEVRREFLRDHLLINRPGWLVEDLGQPASPRDEVSDHVERVPPG
jgi:hypothetical protein